MNDRRTGRQNGRMIKQYLLSTAEASDFYTLKNLNNIDQ